MRIEALRALIAVVWLTALLWPRFTVADNVTLSILSRVTREDPSNLYNWVPSQRDYHRHLQNILNNEGGEEGSPIECCPTFGYHIAPEGGSRRDNMYVELYRDSMTNQTFYEVACHPDIIGKPCRFVDRKFLNQSKCVQEYSYSFALIKDPQYENQPKEEENQEPPHKHRHRDHHHHSGNSGTRTPWALDHIKLRSGCSCQITPKPKKKHAKGKKNKGKTRRPNE